MDHTSRGITAFILAGGKSTRMGADKAFVTLDGRTLLARSLEVARSATEDVRIVGDPAKFAPFAPVVQDVFRNCGPLGGIHAALRASQSELNLILAVDSPFVSPALLQYLIMRAKSSAAALVTVPRMDERLHPLCAIYRRPFAEVAEKSLRAGHYKIDALFASEQTQSIEEEELQAAGFSAKQFHNLNTPEDVEALKGEDTSHRDTPRFNA
jgi:molybdopterin-guanine dinucleotide biosynthesis protein A